MCDVGLEECGVQVTVRSLGTGLRGTERHHHGARKPPKLNAKQDICFGVQKACLEHIKRDVVVRSIGGGQGRTYLTETAGLRFIRTAFSPLKLPESVNQLPQTNSH